MDENVEKNMWLKGRRDLYSKMMFKEIRDAREQEMDVLISKIYEINKPVVRKIVLRKYNISLDKKGLNWCMVVPANSRHLFMYDI